MYIVYAIFGILFLVLEMLKSSILKLSLAITFLFCAVVAYKFPQNYSIQALSLPFFAILANSLVRAIFKKEENDVKKDKSLSQYIGRTAQVIKDIGKTISIDGIGIVELDNQKWSAKSIDDREIKAGANVEIVSKENKILNVKVIK